MYDLPGGDCSENAVGQTKSMKAIYCAGDQGTVVVDILQTAGDDVDLVFLDDDESKHGKTISGVNVVGGIKWLANRADRVACLVAHGSSGSVRLGIAGEVVNAGAGFFDAVHPAATVSERADTGKGLTANAESYVGPNAVLGDHVLVDSCVNISHDADIDDGATLTPNVTLAGNVSVGREAYVGPGATVLEGVDVSNESVVGAGAVVTETVPPDTTVVGVPASPIER